MAEPKHIAIFGSGALGGALAGLLASAGQRVLAVCRGEPHLAALEQRGLRLVENEQESQIALRASAELPRGGQYDLVILLVKSFDTEAAAQALAERLSPETPVLTLQNGLGNAETLAAKLRPEQVLAGTTTFGAQRVAPGVVRLTGRGECSIGAWHRAAEPHVRPVVKLLSQSGVHCSAASNVQAALWKKLAVNAVINPLTAILRVRNGELLKHQELEGLELIVLEEVWRVAARCKIALPVPPELVAEFRRVCRATADNRSSMCRDVEEGRRTEIDAINGAVVRLGQECGVLAPANLALASLIRALSGPSPRAGNPDLASTAEPGLPQPG